MSVRSLATDWPSLGLTVTFHRSVSCCGASAATVTGTLWTVEPPARTVVSSSVSSDNEPFCGADSTDTSSPSIPVSPPNSASSTVPSVSVPTRASPNDAGCEIPRIGGFSTVTVTGNDSVLPSESSTVAVNW